MQLTNDTFRYGSVSQWLHWGTVALVIVLLVMGNAFDIEADGPDSALYFWHGSLGVLVFILAAARIIWLLFSRPPALPQSTTPLIRVLARSTHVALYALLFALPVSGWLTASAERAAVPFFGIATVPPWSGSAPPAARRATRESKLTVTARGAKNVTAEVGGEGENASKELHEILGNVLLALATFHVLAALKHHFVNRDDVLRRMLPRGRGVIGIPPPVSKHELT